MVIDGTGDRVVVVDGDGDGVEVGVGDGLSDVAVVDDAVSEGEVVVPEVSEEVVSDVGDVVSEDVTGDVDVEVSEDPGVSGMRVPGSRLTTGTSGKVGSGAPGSTVAAGSLASTLTVNSCH